jgi:hypothetical protein
MSEEIKHPEFDSRAPSGRVHPVVGLWRRIFGQRVPKPRGPCKYCGVETTDYNTFAEMIGMDKQFRHEICQRREMKRLDIQREDRKKIELIKTAIRELDAEKPNAKLSNRA